MSKTTKFHLPAWTIMLDVVGTVLLAGGILGLFAGDSLAFVEALNLDAFAVPMIILGGLLMAPLIVFAIKGASTRR